MLRLVRTSAGSVDIDLTNRSEGRGCYLCFSNNHLELDGAGIKIKRALNLGDAISMQFMDEVRAAVKRNEIAF